MQQHVHMIGIGGAGMAGIAQWLLACGYKVTGSDCVENQWMLQLRERGAEIVTHHAGHWVTQADVVVASTAIAVDNPERLRGEAAGRRMVGRAEMLAEMMRPYYGIAVGGTHGKTTTSAMVAHLLTVGGYAPNFVIGGVLRGPNCHACLDSGPHFVVEADESDASFLHFSPMIAVVTSIDFDHMATYAEDMYQLQAAFLKFVHKVPFNGLVVLCIDDARVQALVPMIQRPILTYGQSEQAQLRVALTRTTAVAGGVMVYPPEHTSVCLHNTLPGVHNALNAVAAAAVAQHCGMTWSAIAEGLASFAGVERRYVTTPLQCIGSRSVRYTLVDDYGHHPHSCQMMLASLRQTWPGRRVVLVFQPHRYSRTAALWDAFVAALPEADQLLLLPLYAAGEAPRPGIDSATLGEAINQAGYVCAWVQSHAEALDWLAEHLQEEDVLLCLGAGDIGAFAQHLRTTGRSA